MAAFFWRALVAIAWLGSSCLPSRAQSPEAEQYLGDAIGASWNGKNEEAIAAFTKAIALEPKYVLAYSNRSSSYDAEGKLELALADSNQAVELAPRYSGAYLQRGGVYLDMHDLDKALLDFNRSLELRPSALAYYRRGETYFARGEYESAIKDFSQAISPPNAADPENLDPLDRSTVAIAMEKELPLYYRGLAYQHLGQGQAALADLRKAAESDLGITAQLATTTAGAPDARPLEKAIGVYALELEAEPSDDGAYFNPNRTGFAQHDFVSALNDLNAILELSPGDAEARVDRGYVQFKLNDFGRSIDDSSLSLGYNRVLKDAYNNRALAYLTTGEYDRAIADYYAVIRLLLARSSAPRTPAESDREALTYCGLGKAFGLKGDDVNAQVSFHLALRIAPGLAIVYRFRGDYENEIGKDDLALADYSHAAELNPKSAEALSGRAWVRATSPKTRLRDYDGAVADAMEACDLTGWKNPDLLGVLAAAFAASGDFVNAVKWQASVIAITGHEPDEPADAEAKRRLALYQNHQPYAAP